MAAINTWQPVNEFLSLYERYSFLHANYRNECRARPDAMGEGQSREIVMKRIVFAFTAAPLICAAGSATPIEPLTEIHTPANNISQVYPHHHRPYAYRY